MDQMVLDRIYQMTDPGSNGMGTERQSGHPDDQSGWVGEEFKFC